MNKISVLAHVDPSAVIGDNVVIEPFVYVEGDTVIGDNCHIYANAVIKAGSVIGNGNRIFEGSIIGATPQDFRWRGERSYVRIGDNNTIREHVIINRSIYECGATEIGSNSFIMAQTHIGHDSKIGNYCVLGNAVKIAGDVKIGNCTILSSNALVHEGCDVGDWVLVKGGCRVNNNVPPYSVMAHNPIEYSGVNAFVMRKGNIPEEIIDDCAKCFRHLYLSNTSPFNAYKRIKADVTDSKQKQEILKFIKAHDYKLAAIPKDLLDD